MKKKAAPGHLSEAARLILHNNTRWPIYYEKNYDPMVGAGSIIHVIEFVDGKRDEVSRVDVVSQGKILPGKTLSFLVARRDFPPGSQIYVEFNFSWELTRGEQFGAKLSTAPISSQAICLPGRSSKDRHLPA